MSDETKVKPGTRYSKAGVDVDVHDVRDGLVYVRRWAPGVVKQPFLQGLFKTPLPQFVKEIQGAQMEVRK